MPKHTEQSLIFWTLQKNLCSVNPTETEDQDSSREAPSLMDNMELSCTSNWVLRIKCWSWRCCVSVLLDRCPQSLRNCHAPNRRGQKRWQVKQHQINHWCRPPASGVLWHFFFLVLLWKQWLLLSIFQTQTLLYSLVSFSNNCLSPPNPIYWDSETAVEANTPTNVHTCTHTRAHTAPPNSVIVPPCMHNCALELLAWMTLITSR